MTARTASPAAEEITDADATDGRVTLPWKVVIVGLTLAGVLVAMNQIFFWNPGGLSLLRNAYLYYVLAAFLPIVFLVFPAARRQRGRPLPLYDIALAAVALVVCVFFGYNGENIVNLGWDYASPALGTVASFVLWALVLDALRRTAGLVVTIIALAFSLYPLVADVIPIGFLRGIPFDLRTAAQVHAMGADSIMGLPLQTAGSLLIGFLVFGVALQQTGGGRFFYDLAQSVFGRFRGGSAKVSVISSGFMGMMSGSAVSNVLTTGPMTIPAMKRSGFPGRYAAGVEATAATGGTITPPIMGAAAFLMVSFVGVPYAEVALAAAIPALLYFLGIFIQVDAFSAKTGLRGMRRDLLPRVGRVLFDGWPYLTALIGLIVLMVVSRNETQAPYFVIAFLLVVECTKFVLAGDVKRLPGMLFDFVYASGRTIAEIIGIIAGVGLIVGGLSMTGVSLSLARELVALVDGNLILILIAGAVTSFVLGMGMTVSAVYVFLAIVMAPALTELGINPIAAHLFVIYWATVSYITPPVALASFAAANIARTPPMATSLTAMRLGSVKYIIPFAFVLNPALVAQDSSVAEILYTAGFATAGVFFLGCAFEGWMTGVGRRLPMISRVLLVVSGLATLAPELLSSTLGLACSVLIMSVTRFYNAGGALDQPAEPVPAPAVHPEPGAQRP
ncbi:TRAP transporter permease [Brevibacterium jeotgali]|uniref:TRAP transporter, 4TM/12TM fusion protein n=1 Tax=Brevibacterium jeotgali TaxID=1262550 RepID=A0A2H1L479_9MICO|nr:TRAP transporter permease [Brevibacterium jeotgali]TWB98699.1 TRAP transporter 4TM/12TM fusion protein [Brevibacterium jeotgali]SMY11701.1 TRAP transporter, 4TM/12TM fusion protein [Brevibacterium jeotgali]